MLTLAGGGWDARLQPAAGGAFLRLAAAGRPVLVPVPEGADPNRGFHGAFVMAPWTNRLDGGRIAVAGRDWRMAITRPAEDTALHGLVRDRPWRVEAAGPDRAVLACDLDHPPFRCAARLEVALSGAGLALVLSLRNDADVPTPLGLGWHPFFVRPPGTRLRFAARTVFGRDGRNLPIGPRPSAGINGAEAALDGLDAHFAGWAGRAEIAWPDGAVLHLAAEGAWAGNLHVFAPPGAGILCVEPVSHAPDAPNRPAAAAHGPMHAVAPGAAIEGRLTLGLR